MLKPPLPEQELLATPGRATSSDAADDDEFLDPVTFDIIVDPVIGSNGCTYDRFTAYQLMTQGSCMPGCDEPFKLVADNVHFRNLLRRAHPETAEAMRQQREDHLQVLCLYQTLLYVLAGAVILRRI